MSGIRKYFFGVVIILLAVGMVGCGTSRKEGTDQSTEGEGAGIANPASVYCEGLGYELKLETGESGSVCIFPDGSECEEWDFLAGRCGQEHSYCAQQGFVLEEEENSNIGKCIFSDGSSCMEMEYFEGTCGPEG